MKVDRITYLSPPAAVQMADDWFGVADLNHFWVKRRFDVLSSLAAHLFNNGVRVAEIGCGHGLVQRQCEDEFGLDVHGFDLNEFALMRNVSRSPVYCYDIHDREPSFADAFDVLIMFDVIEHIDDHDQFLRSAIYHLKPAGEIVINVPAVERLYSAYDRAAGHVRRYDQRALHELLERSGLKLVASTYWGLPLIPLLILRKLLHQGEPNDETIRKGFHPGTSIANRLLGLWSHLEPIPQSFYGTSLMVVATRAR